MSIDMIGLIDGNLTRLKVVLPRLYTDAFFPLSTNCAKLLAVFNTAPLSIRVNRKRQ